MLYLVIVGLKIGSKVEKTLNDYMIKENKLLAYLRQAMDCE